MAVIVGTDSYGDEGGMTAYFVPRGITIAGNQSRLLLKAMDWLEIQPFKFRKYDPDQALQFPRDVTYYDVDAGVVPPEVIIAQYVAAILIDQGNDLNSPIERGLKAEEVYQAVKVEYQDNAAEKIIYPQLTNLLRRWLASPGGSFEVKRG